MRDETTKIAVQARKIVTITRTTTRARRSAGSLMPIGTLAPIPGVASPRPTVPVEMQLEIYGAVLDHEASD
jgi:hypothetical protein